MSTVDVKSFVQLGKKSKLFFSLAVIAGTFQQVNAAVATSANYEGKSFVKEVRNLQQQLKGKVLDATGKPLVGASVAVKGTSNGTQSDAQGNFSVEAKSGDVLVVTSVGYKSKEVTVAGATITVQLEEDQGQLDEVVVVGYGTMRKSDVTGSIAMVKGADMIKDQSFSPLDALRGKASGVNIFSNSSQPGAYANRVVIRGVATINSSSNPLYVVDGVVMEDFHLLNPND
ncbi:MAG: carboxypeptidase-like regulatory domain-containing protein, partial [Sphingobacterium sp.]